MPEPNDESHHLRRRGGGCKYQPKLKQSKLKEWCTGIGVSCKRGRGEGADRIAGMCGEGKGLQGLVRQKSAAAVLPCCGWRHEPGWETARTYE